MRTEVLLDATRLDRGHFSGMERCIQGLVGALAKLPRQRRPEITVLHARDTTLDLAGLRTSGLATVEVGGGNRVVREQLGIPGALARLGLSAPVWHSPGFAPPALVGGRQLQTVQDLNFLADQEWQRLQDRVYWRGRFMAAARRAELLIAPSRSTAEALAPVLPGIRCEVVPWGLDGPLPELDGPPHGLERGAYFLFVGPVEPRKNLGLALAAHAAYAARRQGAWPLVVLGRLRRPSPQELTGLSGPNLRHLGLQDERGYWSLLANAGALVYPSLYEGFGFPPLEALQVGIPALCSDIPTSREFCSGAATLLPLVAEAWAEAMTAVSRGELEIDREAAAAATSRLSWEACAEAHAGLYRDLGAASERA